VTASGPPGDASGAGRGGESLQAVVRALGSLLMALGSSADAAPSGGATAGDATPTEDPQQIFEDASRRAHATIDEAVARARASMTPPDLAALNARLDRLERRVDAITSTLNGAPSSTASPPTASGAGAAAPPEAGATPAPAPVGALNGDGAFEPGLGSLLIAVGPVSGFQGLMRVQSAIAGVDAVEEVAIEGYARSEATVRALLHSTLEADRVAEALARELGQAARVRESSAAERRLSIALGE
jgi:hypothetical protein